MTSIGEYAFSSSGITSISLPKGLKEIDIKPHILKVNVTKEDDYVKCNMLLPAGSTTNINPTLFINAYNEKYNDDVIYRITRLDVFNDKGESFK